LICYQKFEPVIKSITRAHTTTWQAVPLPKLRLPPGTDSISTGILTGSDENNRTCFENHHNDLDVPGNPRNPLTFINGVLALTGRA
jgi:Ni,Fe-hydrogenase III small subunit